MITTLFCGDVSRTQMNLSDSIVTCVKVMNCWLIPRLVSVSASFIVMGALAVAMATEDNERDAQYKLSLSLAQSFDQEPRKEDPQETLTCVHACANQKKKKATTMHRRRRRRTITTTVFLSFFPPTGSRDHSQKSIKPTRFLSRKASRSSYEIERKRTQTHMIGKHQHPV
jgi:hypothetical protein